jgi:hypothetical protein
MNVIRTDPDIEKEIKGTKTGIISMMEDCDASKIYYGLWFSNK